MIWARIITDDGIEQTSFDAEPWFSQATPQQIAALRGKNFAYDYDADAVAWFVYDTDEAVRQVLDHAQSNDVGFEVVISADDVIGWERRRGAEGIVNDLLSQEPSSTGT